MIHIVHLKHRLDRRQAVLCELETQGISNSVFWEGFQDTLKPSRGIAKAHQQIVAWAASQNLPSVTIAEDDVQFTANQAFNHFLKNEPRQYDLYLGGISYGKIRDDDTVEDFAGTHLYKISSSFYNTFLSMTGEKDIDRDLAGRGKYIVCNPMVAIQRNGYSDNSRSYKNYDVYFRKKALWKG